jgi:hypothetical protein
MEHQNTRHPLVRRHPREPLINAPLSVRTLFDCHPAPGGVIVDQVVSPAVVPGLVPEALGSATGCALLRLSNGSIWMLRTPVATWTHERLHIASSLLADADVSKVNASTLTGQLDSALGLPVAIVDVPGLEPLDPGPWDLLGIARALVRTAEGGARAGRGQGAGASGAASVEGDLVACLGAAVAEFLSALDPAARAAATSGGKFCTAAYNFLVHPAHGPYRRQFAEIFPCLVPHAVNVADDGFGVELREIVDGGKPLVRSLAARWQVRPGVVRHLRGKSIELVGECWALRMPQLAVFLNVLRPEDMPGDEQAGWDLLNRVVAVGEHKFRSPAFNNAIERDWVRHAMHKLRGRGAKEGDVEALGARFFEMLRQLFLQVVEAMRAELQGSEFSREQRCAVWHKNPILPEDFRSLDGSRVIRSFTSDEALCEHGRAIHNCLATHIHRLRYEQRCRHGDQHILGIYDASTGEPCSTVHLAVSRHGGIDVVEHTGANNEQASDQCKAALGDLLDHLETDRYQRWLRAEHRRRSASGAFSRAHRVPDPTVPSSIRGLTDDTGDSEVLTVIEDTVLQKVHHA